jgi:two-component system chemotaxis response regulator CheB
MVMGEDPPPAGRSGDPGSDPGPHPDPGPDPRPDPTHGEQVAAICPECGGVLTERAEAGMLQWECRVGHRYSPDTLIDAQADDVEGALWAAIRVLADRAALLQRMAQQAEKRGQPRSARRFRRQSQAASEQSETVRQALAGAAGTTLRRLVDTDEEEHGGDAEEGAA